MEDSREDSTSRVPVNENARAVISRQETEEVGPCSRIQDQISLV